MDTKQFLQTVWPSQGPYLLCHPIRFKDKNTGKDVQTFRHFSHTDAAAAAAQAVAMAFDGQTQSGVDVYYAMGAVKTLPDKLAGVRKKDNIAALRTFWMDLDVKPNLAPEDVGKAYLTQHDAVQALRTFNNQMGLPRPFVVSSGGGIHAYWPFDEEIDADKWFHYADILKRLATAAGVRQDPACTSDCARVLRVPGTYNWKTGQPRKVEVKVEGVVSNTLTLLKRLAYLQETHALPEAAKPKAKVQLNVPGQLATNAAAMAALAVEAEAAKAHDAYTDPDAKKMVQRCQQLAWQATHQPEVDQTQWYDMVGCVRFATNGRKAVIMMSQRHPDYSEDEVDNKIQQHVSGNFGPTLCATFESHRPGGCDGCPHKGKIKSPVTLGRELKVAPPAVVKFEAANGVEETVELPEPLFPFKRAINPDTGMARIVMRMTNDDEVEEEIELYPYDLHPVRRVYNQREGRFYFTVRTWLPQDGWREFDVAGGMIYDTRAWMKLLGDKGVNVSLSRIGDVVEYMIGYLRQLQAMAKANIIYAQLGWADDDTRFVLPNKLVTANGAVPSDVPDNTAKALKWVPPKGDLDAWKQAVKMFERPGLEALQFMFGTGFGSPLLRFTGYRGVIVNAVGGAGAGKSLALRAANSVWGHHESHWVNLDRDTTNAVFQKLGTLGCLLACHDEITMMDPRKVGALAYAVSQGEGRQRLQQDGTAAENFGKFCLLFSTTSNASLHGKLSLDSPEALAQAARIFEYYVPSGMISLTDGTACFHQLDQNFGLAGQPYIEALMRNPQAVAARVKHWVTQVEQQANTTSSDRFWAAPVACVLAGFELANSIGLTTVDVDRLFKWAVYAVTHMRQQVADNTRTPVSILDDYLRANLSSMLALSSPGNGTSPPMISHEPRGELRIRHEQWCERLYIDRAHFRKHCADNGLDFSQVRDALLGHKVLLDDNFQITLGKNTTWRTTQTRCWMIDTSNPVVNASGLALPNSATAIANQAIAAAAQAATP